MKLIKKDFAAWLQNRHPNRTVGVCGDMGKCALAAYLNDRSGRAVWFVGDDCIERGDVFSRGYAKFEIPRWATKFVKAYDRSAREDKTTVTGDAAAPTAAECLKILRTGKAVKRA